MPKTFRQRFIPRYCIKIQSIIFINISHTTIMMTENLNTVLFAVLFIIFLPAVLWGCLFFSMVLFKKALYSVLDIFWEADAVNEKNARTLAELGLQRSYADELFRSGLRDYKPQALQLLIAYNIVHVTDDEKLYLCEETLASKIPLLQAG